MKLANRVSELTPSITLAVSAKAKALKAQGHDVVAFGAGEPDFDTPDHIKEAAIKALHDGMTGYTPAAGLPALREAVAEKYQGVYDLPVTGKNVVISCGGKHALYNIFQVLINKGDQVLIPAPYWVSYPEMVRLAEGEPVLVPTTEETGFRVTVDQLRQVCTARTKILIINSPSNPTGAAYPPAELKAIAEFAIEKNLLVISDEIYEHLVYDDFKFVCFPTLSEELLSRVIVVSGASKTYAMTGWRIGWTVGPEEIIEMLGRLQSQSTSNPTTFAQFGAIAALRGSQDCVQTMLQAFAERRRYILERLRQIPGIECNQPEGAFYAFPKMNAYYERSADEQTITGSLSLANYLLDSCKVAVVPGVGFGADENIRLSYATSMPQIEEGLNRIEKALLTLV